MSILLSRLLQQDAPLPSGGDVLVHGITSDSRDVKPGFLFAALRRLEDRGTLLWLRPFSSPDFLL